MIALTLFLLFAPVHPARAQETGLRWKDAQELTIEGRGWQDTAAPFDRLPASAETLVRPVVWKLSRKSAGLCVRFKSDASEIHARWSLGSAELAMPHMPATGVSGLDLYVHHEEKWRWLGLGAPRQQEGNTVRLVHGLAAVEREYVLYLPLYNATASLEIGVPEGATLEAAVARKLKPIVFYGTSITQGACASRPGMAHVAQLGRRLERPVINLGFSGQGKLDAELGMLLAEIDAAVYVLDCLPNMRHAAVTERTAPFVRALRKARPDVPILLVEDRSYGQAYLFEKAAERNRLSRRALRDAFDELRAEGVRKLHYLVGDELLGDDGEALVDGSHPSDLGFVRHADAFETVLRPILRK